MQDFASQIWSIWFPINTSIHQELGQMNSSIDDMLHVQDARASKDIKEVGYELE
jgi:hypothetical protein